MDGVHHCGAYSWDDFYHWSPSGWFLAQERAWQPALALLSSMVCAALRSNLITCSASVGV